MVEKAVLTRMDGVQSRPVQWLWYPFLPVGKLVILCGDPGLGKSFLTCEVTARMTGGGGFPRLGQTPDHQRDYTGTGHVILLSAEDDPADTIRPRLEAAGADLSLVHFLEGVQPNPESDELLNFDINQNVQALRSAIAGIGGVRLVFVDPVSAYVGDVDSYNNAQVRSMLKPLSDLAADHDVCVVLVTHLRKSSAARALHRAMGSLAFTAAARVVLLAEKDAGDPELRIVVTVKNNIGSDRTGIRYKVDNGRIVFGEMVEGSADDLDRGASPGRPTADNPAFIAELRGIIEGEGECPTDRVRALAEAHGVSWNTIIRRDWKARHGVEVVRKPGFKRGFWVRTPPDEPETEDPGTSGVDV